MISVVIPTFKNREEFLEKLKINLKFLSGEEIIVINDNPENNLTLDPKIYPNIIVINNKSNLGFSESVNRGVKKAENELIMLLNDDVLLFNSSFKLILKQFENNKKLFGVSFAQKEKKGKIVGKNKILWKNGLFHHKKSSNLKNGITAWIEGGASIMNKKKFLELNGFDNIYFPFYWEDVDLSYRAWKKGYECFFNPNIIVLHQHESTIGKYFDSKFIKKIAYRNQFIFIWKNLNKKLLLKHLVMLPYNLIYYTIYKGEKEFFEGFISALSKIKFIYNIKPDNSKMSDEELIKLFKDE